VLVEHVALWAKDIETLKQFYERYFGVRAGPLYRNAATGFESYFLSFDSGARLEVMRMPGIEEASDRGTAQAFGFVHVAISVGSRAAVDDVTATLRRDGFRVLEGPRMTGDGYYESCVLDPEGNRVEVTV